MKEKAQQNSKIVDALGMPDEWDKRTSKRLINNFEKRHPGLNRAWLLRQDGSTKM